MRRYIIKYLEANEEQIAIWKGYDADHALERFYDDLDGDTAGITIISVGRYRTPTEMIQRRYNRAKA